MVKEAQPCKTSCVCLSFLFLLIVMERTGLRISDLGETEELKTKTSNSSGSLPEHVKGDGPSRGKNNWGGVRLVNISIEFHPEKTM